jgi:hypothetical protein
LYQLRLFHHHRQKNLFQRLQYHFHLQIQALVDLERRWYIGLCLHRKRLHRLLLVGKHFRQRLHLRQKIHHRRLQVQFQYLMDFLLLKKRQQFRLSMFQPLNKESSAIDRQRRRHHQKYYNFHLKDNQRHRRLVPTHQKFQIWIRSKLLMKKMLKVLKQRR